MAIQAVQSVFDHSMSRGSARLVLLALANHADANMMAWPSVETLRRAVNLRQRRNVHTALAELIRTGEITKVGTTKHGVVKYRLVIAQERSRPVSPQTHVRTDTTVSQVVSTVTEETDLPVSHQTPNPSSNRYGIIDSATSPDKSRNLNLHDELHAYLQEHGHPGNAAREHIEKWCQEIDGDAHFLSRVFHTAKIKGVINPIRYIEASIRNRKREPRSNDDLPRRAPDLVF
jgi:hypothetical protein